MAHPEDVRSESLTEIPISRDHPSPRNGCKPQASAAIGAVEQSLRVRLPRRLDLITRNICNSSGRATLLITQPKIPSPILEAAVSHPSSVGRERRIAGFSKSEWDITVGGIPQIDLRRITLIGCGKCVLRWGSKGCFIDIQSRWRERYICRAIRLKSQFEP